MATNRKTARGWPYKEAKRLGRLEEYAKTVSQQASIVMRSMALLPEEERMAVITTRLYAEMIRSEILEAKQSLEEPEE